MIQALTDKQMQLLEAFPLLNIVIEERFTILEKMWFKSEIISHGGFIGGDRKDITSCASYGHFNQIY